DAHEWLATAFVDAVRECLKAGGYAKKEHEVEQGGVFMVAYDGRLFIVYSDYHVEEPAEQYGAVGCGRDYATGALHATPSEMPDLRVRAALSAAAYHSAYVRPPFRLMWLQGPDGILGRTWTIGNREPYVVDQNGVIRRPNAAPDS